MPRQPSVPNLIIGQSSVVGLQSSEEQVAAKN
jgi:hypothetical protein